MNEWLRVTDVKNAQNKLKLIGDSDAGGVSVEFEINSNNYKQVYTEAKEALKEQVELIRKRLNAIHAIRLEIAEDNRSADLAKNLPPASSARKSK